MQLCCAQKVADSCKGIHARDTVILPFDLESIGEALSEVAKTALAVNNNHGPDYIILNAGMLALRTHWRVSFLSSVYNDVYGPQWPFWSLFQSTTTSTKKTNHGVIWSIEFQVIPGVQFVLLVVLMRCLSERPRHQHVAPNALMCVAC